MWRFLSHKHQYITQLLQVWFPYIASYGIGTWFSYPTAPNWYDPLLCKTSMVHSNRTVKESSITSTHLHPVLFVDCLFLLSLVILLLQAGDDSPWGSSSTNHVFVGNWQQVSLLHGQFYIQRCHLLHGFHHLCKTHIKTKHCNKPGFHLNSENKCIFASSCLQHKIHANYKKNTAVYKHI